jgi:ankyrin repeat protein
MYIATDTGFTPLHTAVQKRDVRLMAKCVAMGSSANAADARGWTALHHAAEFGDFRLVQWAVQEAGAAAGTVSPVDGETPLHRAAWGGDLTSVKFLLGHGAPVAPCNKTGWTPAHCAAWVGAEDVLKYLAGRGARLDVENDDGWTPERMLPGSAKSSAPARRGARGKAARADDFDPLKPLAAREIQVSGRVDLPP